MKPLPFICLALGIGVLFLGCQAAMVNPAPLTADVIRTGTRMHVDEPTLREGRRLFVSRCIECHTLPVAWYYADSEWPRIVQSMSHRASLNPRQQEAIVAYIRAIRAQP